jgi:hypothetical protein
VTGGVQGDGTVRIYLPATMSGIRLALASGTLPVAGGYGFAVTGPLRLEYPDWSEEDLEYVAMQDASRASLRLLAAIEEEGGDGRRDGETGSDADFPSGDREAADPGGTEPLLRVVVAVDVNDSAVRPRPELDRAVVAVAGTVEWSQVAALHIDGADAGPAVREAVAVIDAADLGDDEAEFVLGSVEDFDLAWYAPGEVVYLVEELDAPG